MAVTVIVNAGSEAVSVPSLTLILTFWYVPTSLASGVPWRRPVVVENDAHAGRFATSNVSVSSSASSAVGVNEYGLS
jgi:hypothetical protein